MHYRIVSVLGLVLANCILFLYPITHVQAIDGYIRFTNPTGGETLTVGQSYTIRWESSSNIDKVNIGYKSCPSCLDWVVFTTPNSGSYTWNVNVGNTTNTQFYLQITGYETGKGSLTSNSGTFTVNGGNTSNAGSTSHTTPSPGPASSSNSTRSLPFLRPTPRPTPMPTPTPTPIPLTINTIRFSSTFVFEGSQTTDLTKISDPKHVTNFTIDTKYDWTIVFTEEMDLTDKKKLAMLRDIENYWVVEWWFIWIKIEWWEVFEVPCEVTVKNNQLTGYSPILTMTETRPTEMESSSSGTQKPKSPLYKNGKPGEIVLGLTDGGKIEIKPNVQFKDKPTQPVSTDNTQLTARTSHKNLTYQLALNGQTSSISTTVTDDGSFSIIIPKLIEGANYVELSYKEASDSGYTKGDSTTIIYKPRTLWYIALGIVGFLFACVAGTLIYLFRKKLALWALKFLNAIFKFRTRT